MIREESKNTVVTKNTITPETKKKLPSGGPKRRLGGGNKAVAPSAAWADTPVGPNGRAVVRALTVFGSVMTV